MLKSAKLFNQLLALLLMAGFFVACKDDAPEPEITPEPSPNVAINDWIYDVMKDVYFWTDQMPSDVSKEKDPTDYFDALLSTEDRFSWIVPDYDELIKSLSGVSKEAGYEYMLTRASSTNEDVWAIILYTKSNSPAQTAGLERGDIITHVNGQKLSMSNYRNLIGEMGQPHSVGYTRYNEQTQAYEAQSQLDLTVVELAENPNYMHKIIQTDNGKKVGYYVYNFFAAGAGNGSKEYDQEMENIIADFKAQGVNEIVLDLRYNSGGAVSSANAMGSLLGRDVSSSKVFYKYRWNNAIQAYWESQSNGQPNLVGYFQDKAANIGNNLSSGTLYVLTGSRTASASELIINGLIPYMNEIVIIGDKTVGKNVGSIPFDDEENTDNPYGILPIVFEIRNADDYSAYANGFQPTHQVKEFMELPLEPLGDPNEPLLATALSLINGMGARIAQDKQTGPEMVPLMMSIDRKARTNRLIFDIELPAMEPQP